MPKHQTSEISLKTSDLMLKHRSGNTDWNPGCGGMPSQVMFNVICYACVWHNNRLYD